jgi:hypothetical protein
LLGADCNAAKREKRSDQNRQQAFEKVFLHESSSAREAQSVCRLAKHGGQGKRQIELCGWSRGSFFGMGE